MMEAFLTEFFFTGQHSPFFNPQAPHKRVVVLCIEAVVLVQDLHEVNKTILGRVPHCRPWPCELGLWRPQHPHTSGKNMKKRQKVFSWVCNKIVKTTHLIRDHLKQRNSTRWLEVWYRKIQKKCPRDRYTMVQLLCKGHGVAIFWSDRRCCQWWKETPGFLSFFSYFLVD